MSHPLLPPFFSVSGEGDVFFIPFNGIPEDGRGRLRSPEPLEGVYRISVIAALSLSAVSNSPEALSV